MQQLVVRRKVQIRLLKGKPPVVRAPDKVPSSNTLLPLVKREVGRKKKDRGNPDKYGKSASLTEFCVDMGNDSPAPINQ